MRRANANSVLRNNIVAELSCEGASDRPASVSFYGPNLDQATKAAVGIVPSENAEVEELRAWIVDRGDVRGDSGIAREILEFIEEHQVRSIAISDGIIGCPHQQGIDYEGEWCPVCEFWHGRDRFAGQRVH